MPPFTDLTGLLGIAGVITAIVLSRVGQLSARNWALLAAAVFALLLVPFGGLPLAAYVRGATGDPSITSVALAAATLLRPYCNTAAHRSRTTLLALVSLAALFLYPMALGMGLYDPYRLGYGDVMMVGAVLVAACFAWLARLSMVSACLALAMLAWALGWYESTNLWDYLIDPLLAIYAMVALLVRGVRGREKF